MKPIVNLYSTKNNEIERFLKMFYDNNPNEVKDTLKWSKEYENPVEMVDIIGGFIDNNYKFDINMWVSIDEGLFINVTNFNVDKIIRYIFERFPY